MKILELIAELFYRLAYKSFLEAMTTFVPARRTTPTRITTRTPIIMILHLSKSQK